MQYSLESSNYCKGLLLFTLSPLFRQYTSLPSSRLSSRSPATHSLSLSDPGWRWRRQWSPFSRPHTCCCHSRTEAKNTNSSRTRRPTSPPVSTDTETGHIPNYTKPHPAGTGWLGLEAYTMLRSAQFRSGRLPCQTQFDVGGMRALPSELFVVAIAAFVFNFFFFFTCFTWKPSSPLINSGALVKLRRLRNYVILRRLLEGSYMVSLALLGVPCYSGAELDVVDFISMVSEFSPRFRSLCPSPTPPLPSHPSLLEQWPLDQINVTRYVPTAPSIATLPVPVRDFRTLNRT